MASSTDFESVNSALEMHIKIQGTKYLTRGSVTPSLWIFQTSIVHEAAETVIHCLPSWQPSPLQETSPVQWMNKECWGDWEPVVSSSIFLCPPLSGESFQGNGASEGQPPSMYACYTRKHPPYTSDEGSSGKISTTVTAGITILEADIVHGKRSGPIS